ncbi:hypothetical protein GCAAIG_12025 [Candidatus Electronema halotolerans]
MRLKNFFIAASAAFLLITVQQAAAQQGQPPMEQQLLHAEREYWRAAMYLADLQREMDDAKKSGDWSAYKEARKLRKAFEKGAFKQLEKAYKEAQKGNYIWIPVPGWNPWGNNPGQPGQGGVCDRDPGPCLKCENGFIVPDDGDNPKKRCYQCSGGVAVQANGYPCNDYNPSTQNDVCRNGKCKGTPFTPVSPSLPF